MGAFLRPGFHALEEFPQKWWILGQKVKKTNLYFLLLQEVRGCL
jgi:hypothetical protein